MKVTLHATSSLHLLEILGTIDIAVPGRTEGHKSWHCENWSICRFLGSYAGENLLRYPLSLGGDDEAPDYRLTIPSISPCKVLS